MISREALEWVWRALDENIKTGKPIVLASAPPGGAVLYRWAQKDYDKFVAFYVKMAERDLVAGEKMQDDVGTKMSLKEIEGLLQEYVGRALGESSSEPAGESAAAQGSS